MYKKICKYCKNEFTAYKSNTIYCSDKCRKSAFKERRDKERNKLREERITTMRSTPDHVSYKNKIPADDPRVLLSQAKAKGNNSVEYWELFKTVDDNFYGGRSVVNGIPTNAPHFAEAVFYKVETDGFVECRIDSLQLKKSEERK